MNYDHTQRAPLAFLMYLLAAALLVCASAFGEPLEVVAVLIGAAALFMLIGLCFRQLTVRDEGEYLAIRYGPLPVFHRRIAFRDIRSVERGRSSLIDGWGIHYVPGRGTTYNLWGYDCAVLKVNKGTVRVGSDDADRLVEFVRSRINLPGADPPGELAEHRRAPGCPPAAPRWE
jgi:hypothetical protein